jgi:hypothetical protein
LPIEDDIPREGSRIRERENEVTRKISKLFWLFTLSDRRVIYIGHREVFSSVLKDFFCNSFLEAKINDHPSSNLDKLTLVIL